MADVTNVLKKGQTLEQQILFCKSPHLYEGWVYSIEKEAHMFCQVGHAKFVFMALESGNRITHPIQAECTATTCDRNGVETVKKEGCALNNTMREVVKGLVGDGACDSASNIVCLGRFKETATGVVLG